MPHVRRSCDRFVILLRLVWYMDSKRQIQQYFRHVIAVIFTGE